ncbi:MAG: Wzz/FepE/Etk N-terminal domain-containing protein [Rhodoferax sp.]
MPENGPMEYESDDEISLLDLLQVVAENLRLLVLGPVLVGLLALGGSYLVAPTFTATTRFMPPQQQQSAAASLVAGLGALGGLAGAAGLKNPADQYVALLKSQSVGTAMVERFALMERYESKLRIDALKQLEQNSRIASGKDGLISIEVDDHTPALAADMANAYVEELHKLLARLAVTEAQQRRVFFEKQLTQAKEQMTQAERALRATGVSGSDLKSQPQAAISAVAQLQAQVAAQEVKLGSMRGYLAESAPDFRQAQTELASLRSQLSKLESSSALDAAGAPAGAGAADYVARFREFKYYETLFELFAKQYELAKVDEAREGAVIQVVDAAVAPERKSKPKRSLMAVIAALGTGFALLLYVFVRQAWRRAQGDPVAAEKLALLRRTIKNI